MNGTELTFSNGVAHGVKEVASRVRVVPGFFLEKWVPFLEPFCGHLLPQVGPLADLSLAISLNLYVSLITRAARTQDYLLILLSRSLSLHISLSLSLYVYVSLLLSLCV